MNRSLSLLIFAIIQSSVCLLAKDSEQDHLEQGFLNPPQEARPWVYFWWQNNLASKEGVTKDLEELKAKGMAGVVLVSAGGPAGPMPDGPDYMSHEWRKLMKHTIHEAARLGLEVSFNQCGGWNSGGPWITEEMASQQYVSSELTLKGPQTFRGKLPQAPGNAKAYRDVAVQAFRVAEATERCDLPKTTVTASSSRDDMPLTGLTDGDMHVNSRKFWGSKGLPTKEHPEWIQFSLAEPASIQSVWILPRDGHGPRDIEIQTSLDGHDFKTISKKTLTDWGEQLVSFPATVARDLRIVITSSHCNYNSQLLEIGLQLPLVAVQRQHAIKAARDSFDPTGPLRKVAELPLEPSSSILKGQLHEVVDLTSNLAEDGTLTWDVPAGEWTIVRSGHTTTGHQVSFAPKGGGGLEKDWLSREAADLHFKNMTNVILEDSAEHVGSTIKYFYDDSWEAGMPNWTPALIDEFKKYRGYDPSPYLPVLAGYTVGNLDVSDRFLYDYRKTIADCLADNHYGHLTKLANERGMMTHNQGGGPCSGYLMTMDALKNLGRSTVPMGEFWYTSQMKEGNLQNKAGKQAASAAHIYGKRWVKGEAFTSIGPHWEESPQSLKPTADIAFCEGFNRFTFHTYTSSRPEDGKPGYEYFAGTHFNRNITWWDQMPAWTEFIARSQWMLSRGLFVAEVCFYNGDWAPNYVEPKRIYPELGPGYDYDFCNAEVLLTRMSVKDGRIVLPDGMSYKLLSMPAKGFVQSSPFVNYTALGRKDEYEHAILRHYGGTNHPVNSPFDYSFIKHAPGGDSLLPNSSDTTNRGYIVTGFNKSDGLSRCIVAEVPTRPLLSLAELQNWDLRYENPIPPFAFNLIGNSDASPLLPPNAVVNLADANFAQNLQHDDSYCANHVLFDDWFFSGIARDPSGFGPSLGRNRQKTYTDFVSVTLPLGNRAYQQSPPTPVLPQPPRPTRPSSTTIM